MSPNSRTTYALVTAAALVVGAVWLEQAYPALWNDRLWLPAWRDEPARHTSRHASGRALPPSIADDTTLTPADNPVILPSTTEVAAGITLTLTPGTQLYAAEFAQLRVAGRLVARGTATQPILFTTNEVHPDNQLWGGILVADGGTAALAHAAVEHAAPGVGCLRGSAVTADSVTISQSPLGVYTETPACVFAHSLITAVRTGRVTIGEPPVWTDTIVRASRREHVEIIQP